MTPSFPPPPPTQGLQPPIAPMPPGMPTRMNEPLEAPLLASTATLDTHGRQANKRSIEDILAADAARIARARERNDELVAKVAFEKQFNMSSSGWGHPWQRQAKAAIEAARVWVDHVSGPQA